MATKEQERRALAQIAAIIDSLGEDSYLAAAFDGCFELAQQNIDCDFALSMRQRAEAAEAEAERLRTELQRMTRACQTANTKKDELIRSLTAAKGTIAELTERNRRAIEMLKGY